MGTVRRGGDLEPVRGDHRVRVPPAHGAQPRLSTAATVGVLAALMWAWLLRAATTALVAPTVAPGGASLLD